MVGFHRNAPGVQVPKYDGKVLAATFTWTEKPPVIGRGEDSPAPTPTSKTFTVRLNRPRISKEYLLIKMGKQVSRLHPGARLRSCETRKAKAGE
jgi:hypothetical protein